MKPEFYGLQNGYHSDLTGIINSWKSSASTEEVIEQLEKLYCGNIGVEFMHIESAQEREWFAAQYEATVVEAVDTETKKAVAEAMIISQNFDHFVGAKFPTVKRYGLKNLFLDVLLVQACNQVK